MIITLKSSCFKVITIYCQPYGSRSTIWLKVHHGIKPAYSTVLTLPAVPWCFLVFTIYYLHDVFKQAADISSLIILYPHCLVIISFI